MGVGEGVDEDKSAGGGGGDGDAAPGFEDGGEKEKGAFVAGGGGIKGISMDADVDVVTTVGGRAVGVAGADDAVLFGAEDVSGFGVTTVCIVLMLIIGPSWKAGGGGGAAMGNEPAGHAHAQWHPPLAAACSAAETLPTIAAGRPAAGLGTGVATAAVDLVDVVLRAACDVVLVFVLSGALGNVKAGAMGAWEGAGSTPATTVTAVVYVVVDVVVLVGAAGSAVPFMLVGDRSSAKLTLSAGPASTIIAAAIVVVLDEVCSAATAALDESVAFVEDAIPPPFASG